MKSKKLKILSAIIGEKANGMERMDLDPTLRDF